MFFDYFQGYPYPSVDSRPCRCYSTYESFQTYHPMWSDMVTFLDGVIQTASQHPKSYLDGIGTGTLERHGVFLDFPLRRKKGI